MDPAEAGRGAAAEIRKTLAITIVIDNADHRDFILLLLFTLSGNRMFALGDL